MFRRIGPCQSQSFVNLCEHTSVCLNKCYQRSHVWAKPLSSWRMSQKAATTAALMGPGDHCQKWDTGLQNTYLIPHVTSSVSKTEKKIIHSFGFSFTSECEILSTLPQGTNSGESCCHQLFVNREESFLLDKSTKIRKCMKIHWKSWDLVGNWSQICSSLAVKCLYFQHRAQMLDIL